jgi:hypothetical protein
MKSNENQTRKRKEGDAKRKNSPKSWLRHHHLGAVMAQRSHTKLEYLIRKVVINRRPDFK